MLPAIKITDHNCNGNWVEFYEVQSESRPGVAYVVAKSRKGNWGCSCPAWIYQRGKHGDCKHIRHVISQIDRNIQPAPYLRSILTPERIQKIVSRFSLIEECQVLCVNGLHIKNSAGLQTGSPTG